MTFLAPHLQIGFREFKCNLLASQPLVDGAKSVNFVFNVGLLVLVEMNLDEARAIQTDTDALTNNLSREHQVFQNVVVDCSQGTAVEQTRGSTLSN